MIIKLPDNTLDLSKLEKGDFLSEAFLRQLTGFDPNENPQVYSFAVLNLRKKIWDKCKFSARAEGYGLRVLLDNEAAFYEHDQNEIARRKQERSFERLANVDENNLDEATRAQYRKFLKQDSDFLSAQQAIKKEIRLQQARERVNRISQEQPIRIISNGGKTNGTTENESHDQGHSAVTITQRADGESAESTIERVEEADQQEE